MAVRIEKRRGKRRLIIDIWYRKQDGTLGRYRKDAEVQTLAAAREEERRRLAALASMGCPEEPKAVPPAPESQSVTPESERRPKAVEGPLFKDVGEDYLRCFAPSHLKPSTIHGYAKVIRRILAPKIGMLSIEAVDATRAREIDAELAGRQVRPATRRNVQAVLRSVLCRYAVEAKLLPKAPDLPALPKVGKRVIVALTKDEVERILAASCTAHRLAFLLAAYAGLRAGEIRGLRWRDVDFIGRGGGGPGAGRGGGRIIVRQSICRGVAAPPKSGHERVIPLASVLRAALEATDRPSRDASVSLNARGEPWTEFALGLAFGRACKRAGIEGFRFHDLRHFFVTQLFRGGTPAPAVQALAGHAELSTTQLYAHVAALDLEDAIRRLTGS